MSPTTTLLALSLSLSLYILYIGSRSQRRSGMKAWLRFKAKRQANIVPVFYDAFADRRRAYAVPAYAAPERRRVVS